MTTPLAPLLDDARARSLRYLEGLKERRVFPDPEAVAGLAALGELPEGPTDAAEVLRLLDEVGSPATVASAGGRYHGFVIGGSLPAALAAHWLATAWDQNAHSWTSSPAAAAIEEIALRWLVDLLKLPSETAGGFVTGGTMANFACLAAARHRVLAAHGWDVERDGLYGAPEVKVVVGAEAHPTVHKSLGLLGLGRERVVRVPVDGQGRLRASELPPLDGLTVVCLQAGNVNTGAFDPIAEVVDKAGGTGAWVHVDGAFGLWAAAVPSLRRHVAGLERVDSCSVDGHKWLNVPYDCGVALTRHGDALRGAMRTTAAYLVATERREPNEHVPELSRRARGVDAWAALRALGRQGLVEMVERHCRQARLYADLLRAEGFGVLNEVVLNQVLVDLGGAEATGRALAALQAEGVVWCGGTVWQGRPAMRVSVSGWATTDEDVRAGVRAIVRAARGAADPAASAGAPVR